MIPLETVMQNTMQVRNKTEPQGPRILAKPDIAPSDAKTALAKCA
jgi:hypothetical protein